MDKTLNVEKCHTNSSKKNLGSGISFETPDVLYELWEAGEDTLFIQRISLPTEENPHYTGFFSASFSATRFVDLLEKLAREGGDPSLKLFFTPFRSGVAK